MEPTDRTTADQEVDGIPGKPVRNRRGKLHAVPDAEAQPTDLRSGFAELPEPLPATQAPFGLTLADEELRVKARSAVGACVRSGALPHPNKLECYDCGHDWSEGERRHEYDHYLGYAHTYDVQSLCTTCHHARTNARGEQVFQRDPGGKFKPAEVLELPEYERPKLEFIALSSAQAWPRNPKKHNLSSIRKSIVAFGFNAPIILDAGTGRLVAGHGRIEVLTKLHAKSPKKPPDRIAHTSEGDWLVPCVRIPFKDAAQAERYLLSDNKSGIFAYDQGMDLYDNELLAQMLRTADEAELVLETGWSDHELSKLLAEIETAEPDGADGGGKDSEPQIDRAEELRKEWGVDVGQLWSLGDHLLLCGDSTKIEDVNRVMAGEKANLLFTSPPYADARSYIGGDLSEAHLAAFLGVWDADLFCVNLGIIRRDNKVIPYWDAYIQAATESGMKLLSWNVWDRGHPGTVAQNTSMFPLEHEWVLVFGERRSNLNSTVKNKHAGARMSGSNRQKDGSLKVVTPKKIRLYRPLGTVFRSPAHKGKDMGHPAMFPVEFPRAYIEAATKTGGVVAEPFSGSGTTIIACEQLGRKCRAIELSPGYVAVALQRFKDATGKTPTLMNCSE